MRSKFDAGLTELAVDFIRCKGLNGLLYTLHIVVNIVNDF